MLRAAFEDMRSKGLVQPGPASLATHWATSLPSVLLPISCQIPLIDIVLYCGLTMQHAVERDEQCHSNHAMCTANPSRIGKTFDDAALREIVNTISNGRNCLLEIVDFNVEVRRQIFMSLRGY